MKSKQVKKIVLFSTPHQEVMVNVAKEIFPDNLENRVIAYMPAEGREDGKEFEKYWLELARLNLAEISIIDNVIDSDEERKKIEKANILIITGGNTCNLLNNIRKNNLEKAIKDFFMKDEFIYAGFSAGAVLITPTVKIATIEPINENEIGLEDLSGLNIIPTEILPHYDARKFKAILEKYSKTSENEIITIGEKEVITLNMKG